MNEETRLEIGKGPLSIQDVVLVAAQARKVQLSKEAEKRLREGRKQIDRALSDKAATFYGINTGFGSLKNKRISPDQLKRLQLNFIRSHAVGVGPKLSKEQVRAMMLLRIQTVSKGHSGVRVEVVTQLIDMLNKDVIPQIPSQGSVGASGDLAPLGHLALGMLGEGDAEYRGKIMRASQALKLAGISPLKPEAKEGLALVNGTQMMTALGVLAFERALIALRHADVAAAMTMDATFGSPRAYDARVHQLRPHIGQIDVAENLRVLTQGSEIVRSHENCDRVQDAYSIRCAPQVHGAARDALAYVRSVLETEMNSVTDNPLLFPKDDDIISAGNFHGQPVSVALDTMALALTSVASISERRTFRLLTPDLSELPAGLVEGAGLNSGVMMTQVTQAALVSECKTLSHPASVDSIPTWADQEDHVSMGAFAARKCTDVVSALERVVAIELFCGAQALEFRKPLKPGLGVQAAHRAIRSHVATLDEDRYLAPDIEKMTDLLRERAILDAVEKKVGRLK